MTGLKSLSIQRRLFLIIFAFVLLPSLALGWLWYKTSTETIKQNAIDSNMKLIDQTSKALDMYITNLEVSTYPFVRNPNIQRYINSASITQYDYYLLSETIENDLFAQMLYGRSDILGISLVAKHDKKITNFNRVNEWLDMKSIHNRNIKLMEGDNAYDNFHIIGLNNIGSTPVLTVVRKLHSLSSYFFEGMLVVDIDLKQIANISENITLNGFHVKIANRDGQIIFDPDTLNMGKNVPEELMTQIHSQYKNNDNNELRITNSGNENIVIYRQSTLTGWYVIAEIPLKQIIGDMIELRNTTILVVMIVIILLLVALGGFSISITRALTYLQKLMKRVESGDFNVRFTKSRFNVDEINHLFNSFNRMVTELNRLVQEVHLAKLKEQEMEIKQKDSALKAMQSHINPHFLYNTLEIINSHAILENNMAISKMTTSLAHMFRYNIGNAQQVVTLSEEVKHIHYYLEIQKARYRYLNVDFQFDPYWTDRVSTIRLTLQPLLENAFLHGYQDHKKKPSYIGIYCEVRENYYYMQIKDHGGGMDPDFIRMYNHAFDNRGDLLTEKRQAFRSIGLINVHERIRLAFGYPYGLYIERSDQQGTIIEIKLPFMD